MTIVALTPALAALILSRMPASVFSVAPIGIVTSAEPVFGVKVAWPALQVPRRRVMLPVPTTAVASANTPAALTTDWVADSALTATE